MSDRETRVREIERGLSELVLIEGKVSPYDTKTKLAIRKAAEDQVDLIDSLEALMNGAIE